MSSKSFNAPLLLGVFIAYIFLGVGSIAACAVPFVSRDSAMWSHSGHCPNFQYVQMEMQTQVHQQSAVAGDSSRKCEHILFRQPSIKVYRSVSDRLLGVTGSSQRGTRSSPFGMSR